MGRPPACSCRCQVSDDRIVVAGERIDGVTHRILDAETLAEVASGDFGADVHDAASMGDAGFVLVGEATADPYTVRAYDWSGNLLWSYNTGATAHGVEIDATHGVVVGHGLADPAGEHNPLTFLSRSGALLHKFSTNSVSDIRIAGSIASINGRFAWLVFETSNLDVREYLFPTDSFFEELGEETGVTGRRIVKDGEDYTDGGAVCEDETTPAVVHAVVAIKRSRTVVLEDGSELLDRRAAVLLDDGRVLLCYEDDLFVSHGFEFAEAFTLAAAARSGCWIAGGVLPSEASGHYVALCGGDLRLYELDADMETFVLRWTATPGATLRDVDAWHPQKRLYAVGDQDAGGVSVTSWRTDEFAITSAERLLRTRVDRAFRAVAVKDTRMF